jgi:hypothetical protein
MFAVDVEMVLVERVAVEMALECDVVVVIAAT